MNPLDRWREILDVLLRRKLRTGLTALSVAWGIFMLVVLLAAGDGLAAGVKNSFSGDAVNSVFLYPGLVAKPHQGNPIGKRVQFNTDDSNFVGNVVPVIEALDTRFSPGEKVVSRGNRQGAADIRGSLPGREKIDQNPIKHGRFLNDDDVKERRRVAVIDSKVVEALFQPGEEPLGAWINVGGSPMRVIGTYEETHDENEQQMIYIPLTTAQMVFAAGRNVHQIAFTVSSNGAQTESALLGLRAGMAARKGISADDKSALRISNTQEVYDRLTALFKGIQGFVWLIGLGTILAGVVGVSNIMLISVAERTREIGVRKALGAAPDSIVRMIVEEALVITMTSGYLGLVAAVAAVQIVPSLLPKTAYFHNPNVDLRVGLAATVVLALAGTLAGIFPALRAARVNPIVAMRVE